MMPSDSYRLYQVQRVKSAEEIRRADEQAGRLGAALGRLVRGLTRPARSTKSPGSRPGMPRPVVPHDPAPAGRRAG